LVAERLDQSRIGRARVADFQAAARAALGNTQRVAGNFEDARHSFNKAWRILEEHGTNTPAERASLLNALRSLAGGNALDDLFGKVQEYFRRHWVRPGRLEPQI
jgi:hypothetical protein